MLEPVIKVDDFRNLDLDVPYLLNPTKFTLNDGVDGEPSTANLAGTARITFTVTGNVAQGSVTLGKARGTFTTRARLIPDGKHDISGDVDMAMYSGVTDTCDCAPRH